jgi:hypothetical protein
MDFMGILPLCLDALIRKTGCTQEENKKGTPFHHTHTGTVSPALSLFENRIEVSSIYRSYLWRFRTETHSSRENINGRSCH